MVFLKKIVIVGIVFLFASQGFAQSGFVHREDAIGKIKGNETGYIFKRVDAVKNIDRTKTASLKKSLAEQLKIFFSHPFLNPPKGFETKVFFGISTDPFMKTVSFPACSFDFVFYYLDEDTKTGKARVSMDGTSIGISTNDEDHFFRQVGNFWKACSEAKFPLFFEQPPISDSTADYIELNFKYYGYPAIAPDKPYRIVRRNDRRLFVALTRKEFLQFLIAQKKFQINEDGKTIKDLEKNLKQSQQTVKNPPSYLTPEVLKALSDAVGSTQKQIADEKEQIVKSQESIQQYATLINRMTQQEAASPARLDYNKKLDDFDQLKRLVPAGRMEGVGLYKINPDYYDRSAGAPGAQLIFVYYKIPNTSVFEKTELNYLEQKTIDIFNQIDYHQLKKTMN